MHRERDDVLLASGILPQLQIPHEGTVESAKLSILSQIDAAFRKKKELNEQRTRVVNEVNVSAALEKMILLKMACGRNSLVITAVVSGRSRRKLDVGLNLVTFRLT